jgi:DnaJ-class molecular chaperone
LGQVLNHYDVLGVEQDADLDAIRRAWRVKVRLLHPDKHQGSPGDVQAEAASETLRVNAAWDTLKDPERRRRYDLHLIAARHGRTNGTSQGYANGFTNGFAGSARNGGGNSAPNGRRRPPPRSTNAPEGDLEVTCLLCKTVQHVPRTAGRFECTNCAMAWQFAKCEGCNKIDPVAERRTTWKCESCGRQQNATWGVGARQEYCFRCKARTDVAAGVDRFKCAGCGLEHLRCSCGHYRTVPIFPWPSWRCPKCRRVNRQSPQRTFYIAQVVLLVGATLFVIIGMILLAGLLR